MGVGQRDHQFTPGLPPGWTPKPCTPEQVGRGEIEAGAGGVRALHACGERDALLRLSRGGL